MLTSFALIDVFIGLGLLIIGGKLVVSQSVTVARTLGLSEFFIGVVLIGFGTSSPELVISIQAAWSGSPGLAFGNVVGSNTANILFILGITALLGSIVISERIKRDVQILCGLMALYVSISLIFPLSRVVALLYLGVFALYMRQAYQAESQKQVSPSLGVVAKRSLGDTIRDPLLLWPLIGVGFGLILLVCGGGVLVASATSLARSAGLSETLIGITIVAIGTSLPELWASIESARLRKPELVLGNIVGSNLYNIFAILGLTGTLMPADVPMDIRFFHNIFMLLTTFGLAYVAVKYKQITPRIGLVMVGVYGLYLGSSVLISKF